jgi:glucose/arabinose dehydrogenase
MLPSKFAGRSLGVVLLVTSAVAAPSPRAQQQIFEPVTVSDSVLSRLHDLIQSPDDRRLLVADLGNHLERVMDADTLAVLGENGSGELSSPHDVFTDDRGRPMVAETGNDRVALFQLGEASGRLAEELSDGLGRPEGVAQGPDRRAFVTGVAGSQITVFRDGCRVARAGGPASAPN